MGATVLALFVAAIAGCAPAASIRDVRQVGEGIEIEVFGERAFPVRNEIVVLKVGGAEFLLSRYPESGDTHVLIFWLSRDEFSGVPDRAPAFVQYGRGEQLDRWELGPLDKSWLRKATP